MIGFFVGFIFGGFFGLVLMCTVQINRTDRNEDNREAIRYFSNYLSIRVQQAERLEKEKAEGMKEAQKMFEHYFKEELKK